MFSRLALPSLIAAVIAMPLSPALASPADGPEDAAAAAGDDADPPPGYREAYVAGVELFQREQWAEARAEFERAYELEPTPTLLFNIGSTYRREGNAAKARSYYARYLEVADEDDTYRRIAEREVAALDAAEPATPEKTAVSAPSMVPAPRETHRGDVADPGGTAKRAGVVLAIAGAAALGWGIYEGSRASGIANELSALPVGTEWDAELQRKFDGGQAAQTRAMVGIVGGGAIVVGGVITYWLGTRQSARVRSERAILVVPSAGGLALAGRF